MGGKSTGASPDYTGAALAEGEALRENIEAQTYANRPTQNNPWGTQEWSNEQVWDPSTQQYVNDWTQNVTLNENAQTALDSQLNLTGDRSQLGESMMGNVGAQMQNPMDFAKYGEQTNVAEPMMLDSSNLPGRVSDIGTTNYAPGQLQDKLDYSGASNVDDPRFTRQAAEDSLYNRQDKRLSEQFSGENEQMDIKLRNQGLAPGDQAYDAAMKGIANRKTDAYDAASAQAMQMGGAEAQRMFGMQQALRGQQTGEQDSQSNFYNQGVQGQYGMDSSAQQQAFQDRLTGANLQNQARDQGFNENAAMNQNNQSQAYDYANYQNQLRQNAMNEEIMRRGQGLNEMNSLISGQQVNQPQFAGFNQAQAADAPSLLDAAGMQGQQNAANASADNASFGNMMGGAASIGMMMSDRRLKRNIERIGTVGGHAIYSYDYIWGVPGVGVMADEIPAEHRIRVGDYDMVNYGTLWG